MQLVNSSAAVSLTFASPSFVRPYGTEFPCFYQLLRIQPDADGTYTFQSLSDIDTFGYMYWNTFRPNQIWSNRVSSNDDSGQNYQFKFSSALYRRNKYFLVVTTYLTNITGNIDVLVSGPASLDLVPITGMYQI